MALFTCFLTNSPYVGRHEFYPSSRRFATGKRPADARAPIRMISLTDAKTNDKLAFPHDPHPFD
jgi:hypothetical protein